MSCGCGQAGAVRGIVFEVVGLPGQTFATPREAYAAANGRQVVARRVP